MGEVFGHAPFGQNKSTTRKIGKHGFDHFFVKALVTRHEIAPITPLWNPKYTNAGRAVCTLGSGFVQEARHAPIITLSAQALISLFS